MSLHLIKIGSVPMLWQYGMAPPRSLGRDVSQKKTALAFGALETWSFKKCDQFSVVNSDESFREYHNMQLLPSIAWSLPTSLHDLEPLKIVERIQQKIPKHGKNFAPSQSYHHLPST